MSRSEENEIGIGIFLRPIDDPLLSYLLKLTALSRLQPAPSSTSSSSMSTHWSSLLLLVQLVEEDELRLVRRSKLPPPEDEEKEEFSRLDLKFAHGQISTIAK